MSPPHSARGVLDNSRTVGGPAPTTSRQASNKQPPLGGCEDHENETTPARALRFLGARLQGTELLRTLKKKVAFQDAQLHPQFLVPQERRGQRFDFESLLHLQHGDFDSRKRRADLPRGGWEAPEAEGGTGTEEKGSIGGLGVAGLALAGAVAGGSCRLFDMSNLRDALPRMPPLPEPRGNRKLPGLAGIGAAGSTAGGEMITTAAADENAAFLLLRGGRNHQSAFSRNHSWRERAVPSDVGGVAGAAVAAQPTLGTDLTKKRTCAGAPDPSTNDRIRSRGLRLACSVAAGAVVEHGLQRRQRDSKARARRRAAAARGSSGVSSGAGQHDESTTGKDGRGVGRGTTKATKKRRFGWLRRLVNRYRDFAEPGQKGSDTGPEDEGKGAAEEKDAKVDKQDEVAASFDAGTTAAEPKMELVDDAVPAVMSSTSPPGKAITKPAPKRKSMPRQLVAAVEDAITAKARLAEADMKLILDGFATGAGLTVARETVDEMKIELSLLAESEHLFETAVRAAEEANPVAFLDSMAKAMGKIGELFQKLPVTVLKVKEDKIKEVEQMVQLMKNPLGFPTVTAERVFRNFDAIAAEWGACVAAWKQKEYETFGEEMGKIVKVRNQRAKLVQGLRTGLGFETTDTFFLDTETDAENVFHALKTIEGGFFGNGGKVKIQDINLEKIGQGLTELGHTLQKIPHLRYLLEQSEAEGYKAEKALRYLANDKKDPKLIAEILWHHLVSKGDGVLESLKSALDSYKSEDMFRFGEALGTVLADILDAEDDDPTGKSGKPQPPARPPTGGTEGDDDAFPTSTPGGPPKGEGAGSGQSASRGEDDKNDQQKQKQ
eukprot:g12058.t1